MRRIFKSRKRAAGVLSVIAVLAIAGGAYAYLTSSGSGSGSGNVTASTVPLVLTVAQPDFSALGQTQTVAIDATNNGGSPEEVSSLGVTAAPSSSDTGCPAGSFVAGSPTITNAEVPADGQSHQVGTVSVTFTDVSASQNGCIGSGTVSYNVSSN